MKILVCFGTRPEAIKMAPVLQALKEQGIEHKICVTAQHREMLDQVLQFFMIVPDFDLDLMKPSQNLNILSSELFLGLNKILNSEYFDVVLVQGDTTTAFITAMVAFNSGVKVGHVEGGLRTYDLKAPFPEEANRQLIARISNYHFVPTAQARINLVKERIPEENIYYTGNTIVDAVEFGKRTLKSGFRNGDIIQLEQLLCQKRKVILVTAHRRENFDEGLSGICEALIQISKVEDVQIIFPVHPNPKVKGPVQKKLSFVKNIHLLGPLTFPALLWLMEKSYFVISDSGGIQEEAISFNKKVLVTREKTERVEGVDAGYSILTGPSPEMIVNQSMKLLGNRARITRMENPYGDGKAAERIVDILRDLKEKA